MPAKDIYERAERQAKGFRNAEQLKHAIKITDKTIEDCEEEIRHLKAFRAVCGNRLLDEFGETPLQLD